MESRSPIDNLLAARQNRKDNVFEYTPSVAPSIVTQPTIYRDYQRADFKINILPVDLISNLTNNSQSKGL